MLVIWELGEEECVFCFCFVFIFKQLNASSVAEKIERTESEDRQTNEEPMALVSLEMMRVLVT